MCGCETQESGGADRELDIDEEHDDDGMFVCLCLSVCVCMSVSLVLCTHIVTPTHSKPKARATWELLAAAGRM